MRKSIILLCSLLFAVQFATAQQTLYVISKSGDLAAYPATKVSFDNDLFVFSYGEVTEITKESFSASFSVAFKSDEYKLGQTPGVGICYSDLNECPTIADGKIEKGSSLTNYSFSIYGLDAGTTYYYRIYVKMNDAVYYGDIKCVTTFGKSNYKIISNHKFVDLGLPSNILWATCNVGAVRAIDYGYYFAWGETDLTTKSSYDWDTYKYGTSSDNQTKYNSTDGKTSLDNEDDAAYINWGASCRMPSSAEFDEILNSDNCTWTWTSMTTSENSPINGYKVTSVKNGNSIFLPASDFCSGKYSSTNNTHGYYWSNTLGGGGSDGAYCLGFSNTYKCMFTGQRRYYGITIRPVTDLLATRNEQAQTRKISSQQNMLVVDSRGDVNAVGVSSVGYATFNASDKWFTITNDGLDGVNKSMISASCTVNLSANTDIKSITTTPEVGVCYSKDSSMPTTDDKCKILGTLMDSYTFTLSDLISGTTYYYRIYVKLANSVFYGDVEKATTLGTKPNDKIIEGHKFVDLGLPSGLLWAETNIGAILPADDGYYFAWGETGPKSYYDWSTCKYGISSSNLTKYNSSDGKTTLDMEDDAAYVNWGAECRMPTNVEFEELLNSNNCTWVWTSLVTSSGRATKGYQVTSETNGNSIFLPASGCRTDDTLSLHGTFGTYWSSTLYSSNSGGVCFLRFNNTGKNQSNDYCYKGLTVRPVAEP